VLRFILPILLGIAAAPGASADLLDGLVLYLPCDDGSGDRVADLSSSRAVVTRVGRAEWIAGGAGFGSALDFKPDAESFLGVTHDFGAMEAMTFSARLYAVDPDPARWNYLLDARNADLGLAEGAFFLARNREQTLRFGDAEAPADVYPRGAWMSLVVMADRKGVQFYVDGKLRARGDAPATMPLSIGDRLVIGNHYLQRQAFSGAMDDIAIWRRVLDLSELAVIRDRPVPVSRPVPGIGCLTMRWGALKRAEPDQP